MGGSISVIMSGIHMNRLEKERVMPLKPKFYKRHVDDTINNILMNYSRTWIHTIKILNWLLKLTQLDSWIQPLAKILIVLLLPVFFANPKNFQHFEILRYQKDISGIIYEMTSIVLLKLLQILMQKFRQSRKNI